MGVAAGADPPGWFRVGARVRGISTPAGFLAVVAGVVGGLALPGDPLPEQVTLALSFGGFTLLALGLVLTFFPRGPRIAPRSVAPPVRGRWSALNSPADRVPSHGTHGYGQTFAIDLVYELEAGTRPAFGEGRAFRPPEEFPGFGQEVVAPSDGRVVAVRDTARDHRSRSTWGAFAFMLAEGLVRELGGTRHVLGNFVVLDLGDGAFALLGHLQRGSARVVPGQQVRRGEVVGRCGNSGNSSEPHVHFQLMDHLRPLVAAGLPFVFTGLSSEGSAGDEGIPRNGEAVVLSPGPV